MALAEASMVAIVVVIEKMVDCWTERIVRGGRL